MALTKKGFRWILLLTILTTLGVLTWIYKVGDNDLTKDLADRAQKISNVRKQLQESLSPYLLHGQLISDLEMTLNDEPQKLSFEYTIDPVLQTEAEKLLKSYKPDYGAIVTMDATTGRVLTMASFQKGDASAPNLALRGTFPAASIFKIITATAAIDKYQITPDTLIMYNGSNHTLYKKNAMSTSVNKWTRNITLREAFARSINTVFARLSFEKLQPKDLREYAIRFGFNQNIHSDLPFDPGFTEIPDEKNYHLAEIASGFNKLTKMSPIQGAMIAASIADNGIMRVPYIVETVKDEKGQVVFQSEPVTAAVTMTRSGAERLKELMGETLTRGTGRKSFRSLVHDHKFVELEMGGKTGSLHGDNPKGKVDWFVGYAINDKEKIAIAAITVNVEKWTVKSTQLAQSIFRKHFGTKFSKNNEKFMSASSEKN